MTLPRRGIIHLKASSLKGHNSVLLEYIKEFKESNCVRQRMKGEGKGKKYANTSNSIVGWFVLPWCKK